MKIAIDNKREEPLLARTRVEGNIDFEGATPSAAEVRDTLAKQLNAKADMILIKNISSRFGQQNAGLFAYIYTDKEVMKNAEDVKEEEKKEGEAKAEGEKPADAAKEEKKEAPAEDKKADEGKAEEKPAEEKKE